MKRVFVIVCALSLAVVGNAMAAIGSEADYAAAMKEVGSTNGTLGKAITSGAAEDAAKASARLEALFKDVQAYWTAKKVDDATTAATSAVAAAQAISKAVAAKDMTAAGEARTKLGATCMSCHTAHREKTPEGGWKMK
jgi:cytochrome c556